jgi:hypothetical protein
MTSVQSYYAQRDNRLTAVSLTGFVQSNGVLDNDDTHAALATLDVSNSKLFTVDTRSLQLRGSDGPYFPVYYLVGVTFQNLAPPQFYPGFEVNIIFSVKDTNVPTPYPLLFRIQKNPRVALDYDDETTYIELNNVDYENTTDTNTVYTYGRRTVTLLSTGVDWVVKSTFLNNGPSSIYI